MNINRKNLTAKEKLFCVLFAQNGSAERSARFAGYSSPQKDGFVLLSREDIGNYIDSICNQNLQYLSKQVIAGYERLAFGSIADAVKLIFSESPDELGECDLFNVSEIKHLKNGSVEIKFFDRMKALEKLEALGTPNQSAVSGFVNAITEGFKNSGGGSNVK